MTQFGPKALCRRFLRNDAGAATVEAVLWLPAIFGLLVMVADVSMIFNGQARMFRIVQDANRSLSVGRIHTTTELEDAIRAKVSDIELNPAVTSTITNGLIRTTLSIPASSLDIVGWVPIVSAATVTVVGEHYVEY